MKLLFDCETNGLLDTVTKVHSLVIKDVDTGQIWSLHSDDGHVSGEAIEQGLTLLSQAKQIIGHNIIKFDLPVLQKIYPSFTTQAKLLDTLVLARLLWPSIDETDYALAKKDKLPNKLIGRYSLEAFGHRLGKWKGDYAAEMKEEGIDPWANWSEKMQHYCEQDVEVTHALYEKAVKVWAGYGADYQRRHRQYLNRNQHPDSIPVIPFSDQCVWLEMEVAKILARQERWGFAFDRQAAEQLYITLLTERDQLAGQLRDIFGSWIEPDGDVVTVKKQRKIPNQNGYYEAGSQYQKFKQIDFNPNSTYHIASRLKVKYGWQPTQFTPSGQPKLDETILSKLPYNEAKLLLRYMLLTKRIGQVAEGAQSWLKQEKNGRIHGAVHTLGAVTRRMTHSHPNIAQVPSNAAPFGEACRDVFTASNGYVLVGCDADALELRCLAGYMAKYDGGAYVDTILNGDKALGTDMHSVNARALGLKPADPYPVEGRQLTGRDIAKTWFYAFLYGAGDEKLGAALGTQGTRKQVIKRGKQARADFLKALPALEELIAKVRNKAGQGFLISLDGSKLKVRSPHAALNTLLQSAGAIIMKQALVILDADLQAAKLRPHNDYEFCANIHDEWQIDVKPEHVETVKQMAEASIYKAGLALNFACPLKGNTQSGNTWRDTH